MRPEEFDNRLHQKLDELNPVFNEQDWMRLSKKMNASKSPVLFSKRISMILFLLIIVLFGTWMSFRWTAITGGSQHNDGIEKEKLPVSLEMAVASNTNTNDQFDKSSRSPLNDDNRSKLALVKETATSPATIKTNNAEANSKSKHSSSSKLSNNQSKTFTSINGTKENNNSANNSITEEKSAIAKSKIQDQSSIIQIAENGIAQNSNLKMDDRSIINQNSENKMLELSKVEPMQLLAINNVLINEKVQLRSHMKPIVGLKPYKWVVGATGLVAASHFNSGVAFEIKTKKSISFGSGLIVQKYLEQDYLDQNEFAATNEADFTDLIRPRHSKSISFSNIKIKSMDVLLPLSLKYYFPLNSRFALFANASMQLTLYSKTTLDFQSITQENQILDVSDFDQASNSATLINHFTIGGGMQREFKHFVIQTGFLVQKNNSNQPQITKQEMAGQISILYKL